MAALGSTFIGSPEQVHVFLGTSICVSSKAQEATALSHLSRDIASAASFEAAGPKTVLQIFFPTTIWCVKSIKAPCFFSALALAAASAE